jgi:hypothetical protein
MGRNGYDYDFPQASKPCQEALRDPFTGRIADGNRAKVEGHYPCTGPRDCAFYQMCDFLYKNPFMEPTMAKVGHREF